MPRSEKLEPLPLPSEKAWSSIGVIRGPELHVGHQSRVFRSTLNGGPIVVKLSDSRLVDESFARRVDVMSSLADLTTSAVAPVPIGSRLVNQLDQWLVVAYPFVAGEAPDLAREPDAHAFASALAGLHEALARIESVDLPSVAALRDAGSARAVAGFGSVQLLHGDYSSGNTMLLGGQVRVFDFDDCGYGPVEFEVGNTLYMALFDATRTSNMRRYDRFRGWFVDAYQAVSGRIISDATLNSAITLRVEALGRWLNDPERAPLGIRTATSEWIDVLRAFVKSRAAW